jgi:O-antigen/teichoic acid export membrane protein
VADEPRPAGGGLGRLFGDSLRYGALDAANRLGAVLLVPLYTRVLAPADYGVMDLVLTLGMVALGAFFLGQDHALLVRWNQAPDAARRREVASAAAAAAVLSVTAATAALLAARGTVARVVVPGAPAAEELVALALLALPLLAVNHVQLTVLRMRRAFGAYAALSVGTLLLTLALNLWLLLGEGTGVRGVLLAQLLARAAAVAAGTALTRGDFAPRVSLPLARDLVRYGAPLAVGAVTWWALLFAERFAVARLATLDELGRFGVAARVAAVVSLVTVAVDYAWSAFAPAIQHQPDAPRTYARALGVYVLLVGGAATLLTVFAREALALLSTPAYAGAERLVGPLAAALVLRGATNLVAVGAMLTGRTRVVGGASALAALVDVALLAALVPVLGAMGAAVAGVVARAVALAWLHLRTRAAYPVPYPWGRLARTAAVFVAAAAAAQAASRLGLWQGVAVKALLIVPGAAAALVLTGAVTRGEAGALLARLRPRLPRAPRPAPGGGGPA